MRSVFESPTAEGLAGKIEEALRPERRMTPPLVRVSREETRLPLSFAQQRLWFFDQLEPGTARLQHPGSHKAGGRPEPCGAGAKRQ